ncbi:hypothetical protein BT69DRAFT_15001 [Atractiella rhizophila]|nr:hypothetical protein BT69DRAFT_15001 [Atractiella rhizophila]
MLCRKKWSVSMKKYSNCNIHLHECRNRHLAVQLLGMIHLPSPLRRSQNQRPEIHLPSKPSGQFQRKKLTASSGKLSSGLFREITHGPLLKKMSLSKLSSS